jgi:pimeloyl-ACP methyl ester carboxylesterase
LYKDFFADIGFAPEIMVGHSFGGTLALLLAAAGVGYRVIAMDPPGLPFHFDPAFYTKALIQEGKDILKKRSDLQFVAQTAHAAGTLLETIMRHPNDTSAFMKLGPKYNIASQVKTITIPVHLYWGAQDQIVPLDMGKRFHLLIPGSTLTIFPEYGHNYSVTDVEFTYTAIISAIQNA